MPITTRKPLHGNVGPAIKYITQDYKTENQMLVSSNNCGVTTAAEEIEMIQRKFHKDKDKSTNGENRTGYHIIQSFSLEDEIPYDKAHEIGVRLAKELYPNFQSVIATHTDRVHVHNHIVMNSIDMETGKKLEDNLANKEGSLYSLRKKSNDLAVEYGYTPSEDIPITTYKKRSFAYKPSAFKDIIKGLLNYLLTITKSIKEFISELFKRHFNVKIGKEISIKHKNSNNYIRLDNLDNGTYSKKNLEKFYSLGAPTYKGRPLIHFINNSKYYDSSKKSLLNDLSLTIRTKELSLVKNYFSSLKNVSEFENIETIGDLLTEDFVELSDSMDESLLLKSSNNVLNTSEAEIDSDDFYLIVPAENIKNNIVCFDNINGLLTVKDKKKMNFIKDYYYVSVRNETVGDKKVIDEINEKYKESTIKTLNDFQTLIKNLLNDNPIIETMNSEINSHAKKLNELNLNKKQIEEKNNATDSRNLKAKTLLDEIDIESAIIDYLTLKKLELQSTIIHKNISTEVQLSNLNIDLISSELQSTQEIKLLKEKQIDYSKYKSDINNYLKLHQNENKFKNIKSIRQDDADKVIQNLFRKEYNEYNNVIDALKKDFLQEEINTGDFKKDLSMLTQRCSQSIKEINKSLAIHGRSIKNDNLINEYFLIKNKFISYDEYEKLLKIYQSLDKINEDARKFENVLVPITNVQSLNSFKETFEKLSERMVDVNKEKCIPVLSLDNKNYYLFPLQQIIFSHMHDSELEITEYLSRSILLKDSKGSKKIEDNSQSSSKAGTHNDNKFENNKTDNEITDDKFYEENDEMFFEMPEEIDDESILDLNNYNNGTNNFDNNYTNDVKETEYLINDSFDNLFNKSFNKSEFIFEDNENIFSEIEDKVQENKIESINKNKNNDSTFKKINQSILINLEKKYPRISKENFENKNFSDLIYVSSEETINDIHQNSSNIDSKEITNEFEITD